MIDVLSETAEALDTGRERCIDRAHGIRSGWLALPGQGTVACSGPKFGVEVTNAPGSTSRQRMAALGKHLNIRINTSR
jgi:hypothetical protein